MEYKKSHCEYLRDQANREFDKVRGTWIECGKWALPHAIKWLLSQTPGERNNQHIVDSTHILALRSYVAGFLEGNTSASRPWYRVSAQDPESNLAPANRAWLDAYTRRTLAYLSASNFYHASGAFYYHFGVFNTGALFIDELPGPRLHFHNLVPGAYKIINNGLGEAVILILERRLTVKALIDTYGKKTKTGNWDWSNFSSGVRKMYEDGNYTEMIDIVTVVKENEYFNPDEPQVLLNRKWISLTYELGGVGQNTYQQGQDFGALTIDPMGDDNLFLAKTASKRKPFIIGVSDRSGNFEYGEKGPTLDALGLIKSLNKKAIGKDQALEQMLRPPLQGPANLKKSYITTAPNSYVPLDPSSLSQKGLRSIFEINPAIGSLIQDVSDLRQQVDKLYYSDYLLYLSRNPKTRTATETNAIVQEQQLIIGPNLQSLNSTYNTPIVDFVMDFVLDEDPYLEPPPEGLGGQFLRTEFISVFAQAQKAADLPAVDRYIQMIMNVAQIDPSVLDKANLDKLADIYEDRLFLPAGLNNDQAKVEAKREQAQAMAQRQKMLEETLPALAGASKDLGIQVKQ